MSRCGDEVSWGKQGSEELLLGGHLRRGLISSAGGKMENAEKPRATSTLVTFPSLTPMLEISNGIAVWEPDCYTTRVLGPNPHSTTR